MIGTVAPGFEAGLVATDGNPGRRYHGGAGWAGARFLPAGLGSG